MAFFVQVTDGEEVVLGGVMPFSVDPNACLPWTEIALCGPD